jgi:hypothetical protein
MEKYCRTQQAMDDINKAHAQCTLEKKFAFPGQQLQRERASMLL